VLLAEGERKVLRHRAATVLLMGLLVLSQPFGTEARWALPPWPMAVGLAVVPQERLDSTAVAEAARPAVVRIFAYLQLPGLAEPLLVGQGSGMVADAAGHILTNNHVVADGEFFLVTFADGRQAEAWLVGRDSRSDIAVLGVALPELQPVRFGDSNQLAVGQDVIAIGYAVGLPESPAVRGGTVLSLDNRILAGDVELAGLIRSNIPLYPGDSGSPLLDSSGAVVGINAAIVARRVGRSETSFSIPVNQALPIVDSLVTYGRVIRPTLGVSGVATGRTADQPAGLLITALVPESPAAAAGLQEGDIITNVDGVPILTLADLDALLAQRAVGEQVTIEYVRQQDGQRIRVRLPLSEAT
jgi:S1-C subfamily serine protease